MNGLSRGTPTTNTLPIKVKVSNILIYFRERYQIAIVKQQYTTSLEVEYSSQKH